jgi:hypothetical protein
MASNPSSISGCTVWLDATDQSFCTFDNIPDFPSQTYYSTINDRLGNATLKVHSSINCIGPVLIPAGFIFEYDFPYFYNGTSNPFTSYLSYSYLDYNFSHTSNFTISFITSDTAFNQLDSNTPRFLFAAPSSIAFGTYNCNLLIATGDGTSWNSNGLVPYTPPQSLYYRYSAVTLNYASNTLNTFINGNLVASITGPVNSFSGLHFGSLNRENSGAFFLADFIIYNKSLSAAEQLGVETFLLQKYQIIGDAPYAFPRPKVKENSLEFWWSVPPSVSTFNVPVSYYDIQLYEKDGFENISSFLVSTSINRYRLDNLSPAAQYSYRIVACNTNSKFNRTPISFYSPVYTCTKPDPPSNPSFSNISGNVYSIGWTNPIHASNLGGGAQLGSVVTAYPLDGAGEILSSPNLLIKSSALLNNASVEITLTSGSNFKVGIQSVNDAGYSAKTTFTSTISVA